MSQLTQGGLCNGIAGFALAAQLAGIRTIWTSDTDPFCNAVSRKHFPHAHQYGNIYDVHYPPRPDIISAGYPCQPVSYAGQRLGADDDRWLWPQVQRLIRECRPGWFLGENVAGHITMGLDGVLADLEAEGYEVWPLVLPACALGAPHRRDRVWIIAHTHHRQPARPPQALRPGRHPTGAGREAAAHPDSQRCGEPDVQPLAPGESQSPRAHGHAHQAATHPHDLERRQQQQQRCGAGTGPRHEPHRSLEAEASPAWQITQPPLCARNDGLPIESVRPDGSRDEASPDATQSHPQADPKHWARNTLKAAGNALVPQIPTLFFQFIADHEAGLIRPQP